MSGIEVKNALIDSVSLTTGDHGLLTAYIGLDYGDSGHQSFGGYTLYLPKDYKHHSLDAGYAGYFIFRCMQIAGVEEWSKMVGKTIRVKAEHSKVHAIGHILKNDWFNPSEDFKTDRS